MKKKFGIAVLCLLAAVCFSLFFVACDDGEETEEKTITASLSASEVLVGEEVTLTYSASGGETVSVTYSKDGGAAAAVTGTAFTPTERGTYVFTFSAEGYESVTRTLLAKTAQDALFAGGWGTEAEPYEIATAAQLKNIGELESAILAGTEYSFVLTADIDLSGETATGTGNYGSYYVEVIGGTFDGNGHTIFGSNAIGDVFHYTYNDTVFRDLTVEFADGNITRLAAIGAYTASEDLGGGSYATALESLSLTYDNVDYVGQDGVSYYLGNNNAALYYGENCTVLYAWLNDALHDTYNDATYYGSDKTLGLPFRITMTGCDVTGDFTGGSGNSGAAIFLGGQIYKYTFPTFADCSFTGTITGRNVGVLFANSSYIRTNGDYTGNITVENLTVDGSINALGGNSGVSFSNSKTELSGVSEAAKACVNNIAADATLAIDGANDAEYTVTAATNADVSYYEIQLSLATVYWYEDDTYTGPWFAQTNSNNVTIRVEVADLADTGVYKAKAVTLRDAVGQGIVDSDFACETYSKEGFLYAFAEKNGAWYLVMDYESGGHYFKFASTSYVTATVFGYDESGVPLCYANE